MSLGRPRNYPESQPSSWPERRAVMEFAGHRGLSAGATGLLVVPCPNYADLEVDLDDEDEEIVIGIRPKSSPLPRRKTSIDEEESDISEPPSLSGSRRVSFADTVGLSLVQVKEFDKWDVPQLPDFLDSLGKDQEAYFITPFNFMPSSSSEEIAAKVMDQKVELESIELLPETTILKGVIRVLNISFSKAVYVRTSLDNWVSHFDLLAEYIPGSSDCQTDSFSFKLTLVPPFAEQGARVDFCLRYETSRGTFWANNCNRNYVLFCHTRKKEVQERPQKENVKKSCLKTVSSSFSVEESMPSPEQEIHADVTTGQKSNIESQYKSTNSPAQKSEADENASQEVENRRNRSRRNRRKAARAARVRDYFAQKDLTAQDSEPSPQTTQTEIAQEQNKEEKHTTDCNGSIQLEGNADASLPNDSNSKQHEKLNPADAAISMDDSPDESKDLSNTVSTTNQNINKFVSPSSEERSSKAASDCTRLSGEVVDSEKLVSDSASFAFGTVVAPLYHQVSCGVGGQAHSDTCNLMSTEVQQHEGKRSRSREKKDDQDVGLCCSDEKVESIEQGCAKMDIVDVKELESNVKLNDIDLQLMETNIIPMPLDAISFNLSGLSHSLDLEREIHEKEMTLDDQVPISDGQDQLFEKSISHRDKKTLVIEDEGNLSEKQPSKCNNLIDLNSLENIVRLVDSQSIAITQEEHEVVPSHTPQNECLKMLGSSYNAADELSLEFDDKTLPVALEGLSGETQEENVSWLIEPSHHKGLEGQVMTISDDDAIKEPILDGDRSASPTHVSNIIKDVKQPFSFEDLPMDSFLHSSSNTNDIIQEIHIEFGDKPLTDFAGHPIDSPDEGKTPLFLEQIRARNVVDEVTNTTHLINENSECIDGGVVSAKQTSTTSKEDKPHLTPHSSQNDCLAVHPSVSQVFDYQNEAVSSTNASELNEDISQNEYMENKSRQEWLISTPMSQIQEIRGHVENSSLLLDHKNVKVCQINVSNYINQHGDVPGTTISPAISTKSHGEHLSLSLQPFQNDKSLCQDVLDYCVDQDVKRVDESQNEALTEEENLSPSEQLSCSVKLQDFSNNSIEPNSLELGHKKTPTVALSPDYKFNEENPCLSNQISENNLTSSLIDPPINSTNLVTNPSKELESVKTEAIVPTEEGEHSIACNKIITNPDNVLQHTVEKEVLESCTKILEEVRSTGQFDKSIEMPSVREMVASRAEYYFCDRESDKFAYDDVKDVNTECKMSFQIDPTGNNLEDESESWEKMIEGENEALNDLIFQAENEEFVPEILPKFVDDTKLQILDPKVDLDSAEQIDREIAQCVKTDAKEEPLLELRAEEPTVKIEQRFDSKSENEVRGLCTNNEENEGAQASISSNTGIVVNEKESNERIASHTDGYLDKLDATKPIKAPRKKRGKVTIPPQTNEQERSDSSPCKGECNLPASIDNNQEGIGNNRKNMAEETTDKTEFLQNTKNAHDCSVDASQVEQPTFKEGQTSDNDSDSDSESGSEDEMELYMHCLRAVCGQKSSPKASRAVQEKEFRRLSITKGKRLSMSLPSISESLDEDQQNFIQENEPERVEVRPSAKIMSDLEENGKYVWWMETFSCRNMLKTILYATLVLVFLAVAYHYDFIACFGLYVISVIWLFFQGERQTGKNKS